MLNQTNKHVPDVLDCIANLSNDEVFTSPKLVNEMLDMLPQELFASTETKFLDPFCKSGVFLREIVKRLDKGLENKIADKQERIDHIMHKQVFGIAITELTALLSRRTLYCSKYACALENDIWIDENEEGIHETHSYSVSEFTKDDINEFCLNPVFGNIRFMKVNHEYDNNGICKCCGANISTYKDSDYSYEFIHINEKNLEVFKSMQFDVIIGNPPYQLSTNNTGNGQAKPIYHIFVEQAKKLRPRYLSMIIPSRWMTGGMGLDSFRQTMLSDERISKMVDFENAEDCFSGVHIDSGVCYFLWDASHKGDLEYIYNSANGEVEHSVRRLKTDDCNVVIRSTKQASIINKIKEKGPNSFCEIVSTLSPFGIATDLFNASQNYSELNIQDEEYDGSVLIHGVKGKKGGAKRVSGYISRNNISKTKDIDKYKIFFSATYSTNATIPPKPILADPNEICTATFLMVGGFDTKIEMENCNKYIKTKFFRALLFYRRGTIHVTRNVFEYIPIQDFTTSSDIDWSKSVKEIDKQLYAKYTLSEEDVKFIEDNIAVMESSEQSFNTQEFAKKE